MDGCNSNLIEAGQFSGGRHPSPVSILETSFSTESCDSSVSTDSNSVEGTSISFIMLTDSVVLSHAFVQ